MQNSTVYLTEAQYQEYLATGYRRNFWVNVLDVGFYIMAVNMVSLAVVIPSLAKKLAAPALLIAFLPSIQMIGITVPQLFSAFYTERLVRMKLQGLIFGLFQRIPWVVMALLMPLWAVERPQLMLSAFVVLFAFSYLCIGASKPAWGELIAKSIPTRMRGRFMGQLNFWGALAGLAGSFFVHQVLTDTARPWENRYALLFGVCSVLMFISYALFTANKEPLLPPPAATHRSMGEYLGALPALLRKDRGFTRFVIASVLASTNTVGQAFLLIFVLKDRALSDSAAGSFAISSALGSVCASLLLGWIGDRHGYKRVMMLSFLIYCLSMGLVMVTQGVVWAHVAFFGLMFNWVGTQMVSTNMVFEFAPPGKRPTYLGVANTLVAPALLLSSLAGGLLAPLHFGYQWALALSALCSLGGLVVMAGLKDPRKVNQGERV